MRKLVNIITDKLRGNCEAVEKMRTIHENGWGVDTITSIGTELVLKNFGRTDHLMPSVEETELIVTVTDVTKFMGVTPTELLLGSLRSGEGVDGFNVCNPLMLLHDELCLNRGEGPYNNSAVCYNIPDPGGRTFLAYKYGVLRCDGTWEVMRSCRSSATSVRGFSLETTLYANEDVIYLLRDSSAEDRVFVANSLWNSVKETLNKSLRSLATRCAANNPNWGHIASDDVLKLSRKALVRATLMYHLCVTNTPQRIGRDIQETLGLDDNSNWMHKELFNVFVMSLPMHPYDAIWYALMSAEDPRFGVNLDGLRDLDITNPALPMYYLYTRSVESSTQSREEQVIRWIKENHRWKPFLADLVRCGMLTIDQEVPLDKEDSEVDWVGGTYEEDEDYPSEYSETPREHYYAVIPCEVFYHIPNGENYVTLGRYGNPFFTVDERVDESDLLVEVKVFYSYIQVFGIDENVGLPRLIESTPIVVDTMRVNTGETWEEFEHIEIKHSLTSTLKLSLRFGYYIDLVLPHDPKAALAAGKTMYAMRNYADPLIFTEGTDDKRTAF